MGRHKWKGKRAFGRAVVTFAELDCPCFAAAAAAAAAAVGYYYAVVAGTWRNSEIGGLRMQLGFLVGKDCREAAVREARG